MNIIESIGFVRIFITHRICHVVWSNINDNTKNHEMQSKFWNEIQKKAVYQENTRNDFQTLIDNITSLKFAKCLELYAEDNNEIQINDITLLLQTCINIFPQKYKKITSYPLTKKSSFVPRVFVNADLMHHIFQHAASNVK